MIISRSIPQFAAVAVAFHLICGSVDAQGDRVPTEAEQRATLLQAQQHAFGEQIHPLLTEYCIRCHNADEMTSGIRVDHLSGALDDPQLFLWKDILKQVESETMPPEDEPLPTEEQRQIFVEWIRQAMLVARSRPAEK